TFTSGTCSNTATTSIVIIAAPAIPAAIQGPLSTCAGASGITYSISSVNGATGYTWTFPSGWTITSGQGTTTVQVTAGNSGGNVRVTANNNCGSSAAKTLSITVTSPPARPGTIT